jgi:hypothetical protein
MGLGKCYNEGDTRTAQITETGKFSNSGQTYAKIVVKVNDKSVYDYGVRLWINLH